MTTTYYDTTYGNFQTSLYEEIRREAYGEDIGQNGWLTADEQNKFISWLGLTAGKTLLDVACGAGGPALRIAVPQAARLPALTSMKRQSQRRVPLRVSAALKIAPTSVLWTRTSNFHSPKPASTPSPALMPSHISRITLACSGTGLDC